MVTEEQQQQLQSITIVNGINALDYVLQQPEDNRYWIAAGIGRLKIFGIHQRRMKGSCASMRHRWS